MNNQTMQGSCRQQSHGDTEWEFRPGANLELELPLLTCRQLNARRNAAYVRVGNAFLDLALATVILAMVIWVFG